ncbi:hypothetical protein X943_003208 [Babesia divergens]|uniref:Uncharacterized protein n=1 Tax=Babesia divergens TaxID=32595 RepID=A0AAD9LIJ7_BABDI|nr:hypothetical protein X943_003208 [Babesia divergens]
MSSDSTTWASPLSYEMGVTAGPLKYGFVPKDGGWENGINEKLKPFISKLTGEDPGSLEKLPKALEPSSSVVATAGGVFTGLLGTGGLGASAAYATNAFGLKDIITGLISRFLN